MFSRKAAPKSVPANVEFVAEPIPKFAEHIRKAPGKNLWLMGGGDVIGSFLDADAIDEFILTVVPVFIGEGIPLLGARHRQVELRTLRVEQFPDGCVQHHYEVARSG